MDMLDPSLNSRPSIPLPPYRHSALLIVDMQYDFLPGGALPVVDGDTLITGINDLAGQFSQYGGMVLFTQDWHPKGHKSFASSYPGKKPGDPIRTEGLGPVLWPDHCVQNTPGAVIHKDLLTHYASAIFRKGMNKEIDSYSVFFENDRKTKIGLAGYLRDNQIRNVVICGLALDYCCFYSAMDARREGFEVYFLQYLSKGIDIPPDNIVRALTTMQSAGIFVIPSL